MPIGICVNDVNGNNLGIGCNLEDEIIDYFTKLQGYTWLSKLIELDPYDDTKIHRQWVEGLLKELTRLLQQIRNKRSAIPAPPTRVGTDGSRQPDAGVAFDIKELDRLIRRILPVLQKGLAGDNAVWAIGD